jgi:hypothetical protein
LINCDVIHIQAVADSEKPSRNRREKPALEEEITSESEGEENDEAPRKRKAVEVDEEETEEAFEETAQEKRVRLAREYLDKMKELG